MDIVELELTSADIAGALETLTGAGICVLESKPVDMLTLLIRISRRDLPLAEKMCQKRGDTLKLRKEKGLLIRLLRLCSRPMIPLCFASLLFMTLFIPTRVLFVQVEGNMAIPTNRILEAAEESGIRFGMSRRQIRSEDVKNSLLEALPELKWAGINTYGCVAVITVRERPVEESREASHGVSSIVAACDGVVISASCTAGTLLCQPGQAVRGGQVLISGYTDCGRSIRAEMADGEIVAQTRREITIVTPCVAMIRGEPIREEVRCSLIIGKKRINLWKDSGISDATCGRMYEEYYITLPGGFSLPLIIVKETVVRYAVHPGQKLPQGDWLETTAENFLIQEMICGQIQGRKTLLHNREGLILLQGDYLCMEMIGRQRREEIGVTNGKDN